MKKINISSFDPKSLRVTFELLTNEPETVLLQYKWNGAVFYHLKETYQPSSTHGSYWAESYEKRKRFFDEIEVVMIGVDWEEQWFYQNEIYDCIKFNEKYKDLPVIESPNRDYTLGTYIELFMDRIYEKEIIDVEEGDVCVDIGANIGLFAIYANQKKAGRILCYEPGKNTFKYLVLNTEKYDNVKRFKEAVSDTDGVATFKECFTDLGSAGSFLDTENSVSLSQPSNRDFTSYEVKTTTIDSLMKENNLSHIDYLKIDCEGSEEEILQTLSKEDFRKIRKICVEAHDDTSLKKIQDLLDENDFVYETYPHIFVWIVYAKNQSYYKN